MKKIVLALIVCLWAGRADAQIAFVGCAAADRFNNSSLSVSVSKAVTAGNLLLVGLGSGSNSSVTSKPSDTVNTYTFVDGAYEATGGTSAYVYWAAATTTATLTVSAGFSVANWVWITICEFSGADTTAPVDVSGNKADFNTGTGVITSSSFTPSTTTDVGFACAFSRTSGTTFTQGTGYTLTTAATNGTGICEYKLSLAASSQTASLTFTPDPGSLSKALGVGAFKQSGAAPSARPCIIGGGLICDEDPE